MSSLPILIVLLIINGDIPDPDRNAHDMWVNQLLEKGSLIISEKGIFDDWQLYYPNTVPKPIELVISFIRAPGGKFFHGFITYVIALLTLIAAWNASNRGTIGFHSALFLGLNPAFIILVLRGNPAIPFLCGMYLLQSKSIRNSTTGALLASFSRPEGFIYSGYHVIKNRRWKLLMMLGFAGVIWLVFHKLTCGSFLWAAEEVKYSVAAMAYPTTNPITFFPWATLRLILVIGMPASAILLLNFKKWKLKIPFIFNFVLLLVSLAAGSLVLPRYIDQLFLLSIPFIVYQTHKLYTEKARNLVVALLIISTQIQWVEVVPELKNYIALREVYRAFEIQDDQVIASNELLIPGICLANDINNPIGRFISVDKAAWENVSEASLLDFGVTDIIIIPTDIYFPQHTKEWLENIRIKTTYY